MKVARAFKVTAAAILACNVAESEAQWLVGTTYAAAAVVRQTVDGVHRRFSSIAGSNLAHDPAAADSATYWIDEGPTNRWAALDQRLQQQTSNADSMHYQLQLAGRVDCLYLGNLSGQTCEVKLTDAVDGVVYDKTFDLVSASGITDWYRYFAEPIVELRDLGLTDLPPLYSDLVLDVTITHTGSTVLLGELVTGLTAELGGTRPGPRLGNKSYSSLGEDAYGDDFIIKRGKKRTGGFEIIVDNRHLDEVTTLLDDLDATAVLFIGNDGYASMFIFGLLLGWDETVSWKTRTALSLNLQSFTRT